MISTRKYKCVDIATTTVTGCTCCGMHVAVQLTVMQNRNITCRTTSLSKMTLKNLLENTPVSTSGSSLIFLAFTCSMPKVNDKQGGAKSAFDRSIAESE